jgi:hypothetical protein
MIVRSWSKAEKVEKVNMLRVTDRH